jgi:hypothetical protein
MPTKYQTQVLDYFDQLSNVDRATFVKAFAA